MKNAGTIIIFFINIMCLFCDGKMKSYYYNHLEPHTNRYQEGTQIDGVNNGIWIYYSDNSYQVDSISYFGNNGMLKWTKQFYDGYPVILINYSYKETKRLVINKFNYERMNGLKSYIYPSYLAGKNIYSWIKN